MASLGLFIALGLSIIIALALYWVLRKILPLIINGVLGLTVFWLLSALGLLSVPLDWITFLIAAIGGAVGVVIVLALAALGIPL
ncbi:MAG: sigmaK-factor processing regulatory BofA [Candidatus Micrarchaeota archaeon]